MTEMKPILTVCPEEYPGTTSVLKHFNPSGLVEHSTEISPETVIGRKMVMVGGWHQIYYEAFHKIRGEGIPTALFWTSSVGQTDFSNDGVEVAYLRLITDLLRSDLLNYVMVATPSVQNMLQHMVHDKDKKDRIILLPYGFDWEEMQTHRSDEWFEYSRDKNWVDLFCPADTRKNILVQMHGAKIANVHVHCSGLRPKYRNFAEHIGLNYTDLGWMSKDTLFKQMQMMKLGLQITYAETFDYVVAEHFALKRPCLISTVMGSWVDKNLWEDLMVYNIDEPFEVADMIMHILKMSEIEREGLNERCFKFMKEEADRRNENVQKILTKVLEELE